MTSISLVKPKLFFINRRIFKILVSVLLLLWILGIALLPLFHKSQLIILFPFLKKIYSEFCHQVNYKTINIFGYSLLVCSRCTGIYTGAFISSIALIFMKKNFELNKKLFYTVAIVLLLDVLCSTIGIYDYSKTIAFATGLFFGSVVFAYILTLIDKFLYN